MKEQYFEQKIWQQWINLVEGKRILSSLRNTPKKYRLLVAALLSCAKWHPLRQERGGTYINDCGLCMYYCSGMANDHFDIDLVYIYNTDCRDCPLIEEVKGKVVPCYSQVIWRRWNNSFPLETKNEKAEPIFQKLLKIYKDEYEKVLGS